MDEYSKHYEETSFWTKARTFARSAGRKVVGPALVLYHALQDSDTPAWARSVIVGTLGYFILPSDAIPDFLPGAGLTDDLGALTVALGIVAAYIKREHRDKARRQLDAWLGPE